MLKFLFSTGCMFLFITLSSAQLSTYDFSKYKLTDYKAQSLNLYFNLGGQYIGYPTGQQNENTYKKTSFNTMLRTSYGFIKNTRNIKYGYAADLSLTPSYLKSEGSTTTQYPDRTKSSFAADLYLQGYRQQYYNEKNYFILNAVFDNRTNISKVKNDAEENTKQSSFDNYSKVSIGHGHGRVEDITYGWHAYRILLEMKKMGVNNADLDASDIDELGDILARKANKRYLDSRINRIESIEEISNYLEKKGLETDAKFYTTLYDMFYYGIAQRRYEGRQFSYGIYVSDDYHKSVEGSMEIADTKIVGGLNVKYEKYKVLKNWQFDYAVEADVYRSKLKEFNVNSYLVPKVSLTLGYYPNSRTSFISKIRTGYRFDLEKENLDFDEVNLSWKNTAYFYLSPQLRLKAHFSFYKNTNISSRLGQKGIKTYFGTGVNYYIF